MFKWLFFCLFVIDISYGLVPIEGILLGTSDITKQFDPLAGVLNRNNNLELENQKAKKIFYLPTAAAQTSYRQKRCSEYAFS